MKWLVDNWSLLVVLGCAACVGFLYVKNYTKLPTEEQIKKVKEWLLYAVIEAEKDFGGGTGQLKLRAVYNEFCQVFPDLAKLLTFATFSLLVDDALTRMKKILEYNKDIEAYVEGKEKW